MAVVVGTIRSGGQGVAGLLVKAVEETRIGFDLEDGKPCTFSAPVRRQIGEATTDAGGHFSISYTASEHPEEACGFTARVSVTVFDGATLVWQSPKKSRGATTRFDHDILPPPPPPPDGGSRAQVVGTVTRCRRPAVGYRVVAYETVKVGIPVPPKPCRMSLPRTRHIGTATVDSKGKFAIAYAPTPEPGDEDVCAFSATVQVRVFDGAVEVWRSDDRAVSPVLRFDRELYPECPRNSTLVRVVNERGQRVAGAEVFADGVLRGVTDHVGQLFVSGLKTGSVLVARLRVLEQQTSRKGHNADSTKHWNYRVYITSATLTHDAAGSNPKFDMLQVADPGSTQDLVVRRRNTLIGFNLVVSVEWDATTAQMLFFRDRMLEFSELLFNGTDGQFLIERVSITDNRTSWDNADYRVHANWNQPSNAAPGAISGSSGVINMNPYDMLYPGVALHEFGHYGFNVYDEYKPADCWPEGAPVLCTLQADDQPPTPFTEGNGKDSCFMRGAQFASRKKLCSSHPANPHVNCTAQGDVDCWSVVAQRYGGNPAWQLLTPVSRGAIVDRLPDSGVPLGTSTMPGPGAAPVGAYIPVTAWRPRWHVRLVTRPGECPDLIVRVTRNGTPVDGARVTLQTADGRSIYQGLTGPKNLPDGVVTGPGEIAVRGAHVGDSINASVRIRLGLASVWVGRTVSVAQCTSPLVIDVPVPGFAANVRPTIHPAGGVGLSAGARETAVVPPSVVSVMHEGAAEPIVLDEAAIATLDDNDLVLTADEETESAVQISSFDTDGNAILIHTRIAQRLLLVDEPRTLTSALGDVELVLPSGAIECPARVVIDEALDVPTPPMRSRDALLVVPHRVTCSRGEALKASATLHLNGAADAAAARKARKPPPLELMRYDAAAETWSVLPARIHAHPPTATARIERLGVFAFVRRGRGGTRPSLRR
jgi:hypothetical protein